MSRSSESYHASENVEPLLFVKYRKKAVTKYFIFAVVVITNECLQVLVIFVGAEGVFDLLLMDN